MTTSTCARYLITSVTRTLLVATLASSVGGCMILGMAVGAASVVAIPVGVYQVVDEKQRARQALEDRKKRVSQQSMPRTFPATGALRLVAYPLNATYRQGQKPFVICVVAVSSSGNPVTAQEMPSATLDPARILLIVPDLGSIRPSAYAIPERCPYPEFPLLSDTELDFREIGFHEIDFSQPLVWKPYVSYKVNELALRFDIETPKPDVAFSLDLGSLTLGQIEHLPGRIEFRQVSGKIFRLSSG